MFKYPQTKTCPRGKMFKSPLLPLPPELYTTLINPCQATVTTFFKTDSP